MKAITTAIGLFCVFHMQAQTSFTVLFDFDQYSLSQYTRSRLDSFLLARKENINALQIHLHGHCDIKGSDKYNLRLSNQRVAAVKNYLLSKGLPSATITGEEGHGKRELINENKNEEERWLNRRVTVSFVTVINSGVATSLPELNKPDTIPPVTLKEKLTDTSLVAGSNIVLQNINFVGGMRVLLPESSPALEELLDAMKSNPRLVIRVEGHVCCLPDAGDGPDLETGINNLSHARARAVRDYLIADGIAPDRVSYKGFGHTAPLYPYPEKNEAEQIANRRVEIKIIHK